MDRGDANKFWYYASQTALKEDEIDQTGFKEAQSGKTKIDLDLTNDTTDLHLYLKIRQKY